MASSICTGCDLYRPKNPRLHGRECAALTKCTENDCCGMRIPPLPKNYPGRFAQPDVPRNNTEPQAIAEGKAMVAQAIPPAVQDSPEALRKAMQKRIGLLPDEQEAK